MADHPLDQLVPGPADLFDGLQPELSIGDGSTCPVDRTSAIVVRVIARSIRRAGSTDGGSLIESIMTA
jgi:hypothetical protein